MICNGTNGISRLELKTKMQDQLNLMSNGKISAKQQQNNGLSEKFKYKTVQIFDQSTQEAYAKLENGSQKTNAFPWGRKTFSVTKNRKETDSASPYAAVKPEVPN